ncbi:MAG: Hsp20/alpha crystallin family protein [Planctomycetia bacterium]|nr:Hsp20/alpha crystallin family protein [Planctomycetia bacterium]
MSNTCTVPATSEMTVNQESVRTNAPTFTPRVDVWETDHEFQFHAELPGVEPANISLNFENGYLTLQGKVAPPANRPGALLREYAVGDYYRQFSINDEVDVNRISAEYKLGVLTVKLPKREELKPRKIEITA